MKTLAFLVVACALYTVPVTAVLRWGSPQDRAALMMGLSLLSMVPLYFAFKLTSAELSLLPSIPGLILPNDVEWFLVPYTAAIWGGILQLYNLGKRGFSLRILIDIDESSRSSLGLEDILRSYGAGKGIAWMLQKRVDDLVQSWSLTRLQQRLFKTGGRLIRHARHVILQLAGRHCRCSTRMSSPLLNRNVPLCGLRCVHGALAT
jgi:hypothetical protein